MYSLDSISLYYAPASGLELILRSAEKSPDDVIRSGYVQI